VSKKTLVLGASLKTNRYSNFAIKKLIKNNHEVVAVGMIEGEVNGVKIETKKPDFNSVDTVALYLNAKRQKEYYDYIISLKPKRVIFNPGTKNMEFMKLLEVKGIEAEEACTLVLLSTKQY